MQRWLVLIFCSFLIAFAHNSVGHAQAFDPFEAASEEERALMVEFSETMLIADTDSATALEQIRNLLTRLKRPTVFRGMVQTAHAMLLSENGKGRESLIAIDEAMRLLPDVAEPKFLGVQLFSFSDNYPRSVDLFLRTAAIDPQMAAQIDYYTAYNLLERLDAGGQYELRDKFALKLLEIGYNAGPLDHRSNVAFTAFRSIGYNGYNEEAAKLIPQISHPGDLFRLLIDRQYEPYWEDLEAWGGFQLKDATALYESNLRDEWQASNNLDAGLPYIRFLNSIGKHATAEEVFLDRFYPFPEEIDDSGLTPLFYVSPLARALSAQGKDDMAERLFHDAYTKHLDSEWSIFLNVSSNYARFLLEVDRSAEALPIIEHAIKTAESRGDVNAYALYQMRMVRAKALFGTQKSQELESELAILDSQKVLAPVQYLRVLALIGKMDDAKSLILDLANSSAFRLHFLMWAQGNRPCDVEPERTENTMPDNSDPSDALRCDPNVMAAVEKYGRFYDIGDQQLD